MKCSIDSNTREIIFLDNSDGAVYAAIQEAIANLNNKGE